MNQMLAMQLSPWDQFLGGGSRSACPYLGDFVRVGSPGAGLVNENARLRDLERETAAGNDQELAAATICALRAARDWLPGLVRATELAAWPWVSPHITCTSDGETALEWWRKDRKISLYLSPGACEYIKVWGANIETEMESGELATTADFFELWVWLGGH